MHAVLSILLILLFFKKRFNKLSGCKPQHQNVLDAIKLLKWTNASKTTAYKILYFLLTRSCMILFDHTRMGYLLDYTSYQILSTH